MITEIPPTYFGPSASCLWYEYTYPDFRDLLLVPAQNITFDRSRPAFSGRHLRRYQQVVGRDAVSTDNVVSSLRVYRTGPRGPVLLRPASSHTQGLSPSSAASGLYT